MPKAKNQPPPEEVSTTPPSTNGESARPATRATVEVRDISELKPDSRNANIGTQRGGSLLEKSIERLGLGRSILLDKHGNVIAGNKTHGKAGEMGFQDVIVVPTDGTQIVAVQRMDLDLYDDDDPRARELAYADNRVQEVDLEWSPQQLAEDLKEGRADIGAYWRSEELEQQLKSLASPLEAEAQRILAEAQGSGQVLGGNGGLGGLAPASHVRMVQLFYNEHTQPEFMRLVESCALKFNTTNPTDTVLEALRYASDQA